MSQLLDVVKDDDLDLQDLLEKQIEGIHNSVNGSKTKIRFESSGLEVGTNEHVKDRRVSTLNVREPEVRISQDKSSLRRSTRSQKASQRVEIKNPTSPMIPSPSVQEELPENKSPLNPLAARAAFASLMSKFPQSLEVSLNKEGERFTDLSEAALKPIGNAKSLFSTGSPDTSEVSKDCSTVLVNRSGKGHKKAEGTDIATNVTQLREQKVSSEKKTRLTRATVGQVERSAFMTENKLSTTPNRRFTRSVLRNEGERQTIETTSEAEMNMSNRNKELITSKHKVMAEGSFESKDKKTVATTSLSSDEINSLSIARNGLAEMEQGNKETDIGGKTHSVVMKNSSRTRRLTRSSINKDTRKIKTKTIQESGSDEFPKSELSGETDSVLLKTTKAITKPFEAATTLSPAEGRKKRATPDAVKTTQGTDIMFTNASIDSLPTEQRNKRKKTSGVAITTQDSPENVRGDDGCSPGFKRKSINLKGHEVRSSPRFRPKT